MTGIAAVLLLALAGSAAAASPDTKLVRAMEELADRPDGPPGVAAIVRGPGGTRFHTAGVAAAKSGREIRRTDHMRIASTSKAFSGAVALSLVQSGQLQLDDTVGEYLPYLPVDWHDITIAQLLQHTSGIPSFTKDIPFLDYFTTHLRGGSTPDELLEWVYDTDMIFTPPGSSYDYSNSDNIVVGLIAEAITGQRYEDVLRQRVLGPLGLTETELPPSYQIPRPRINGYDRAPLENVTTCCSMAFVWASGGMYSTPRDLHGFARAYIGGELFEEEIQDAQFDWFEGGGSEPPGPGANSAGLGVFRYETSCGTVYGHTGNFPGYTQFFAATPDGRHSMVVSANLQLAEDRNPDVFEELRRVDRLAVCAALNG